MNTTILLFSTIAITLALVFYSIGVWSEKLVRILKPKHLAFFWSGFVFDTTGTTLMTTLVAATSNGNFVDLHAVTGVLAILLMLSHAIWATLTLVSGNENRLKNFHKFSLAVWVIWLVPYCLGFIANIPGI